MCSWYPVILKTEQYSVWKLTSVNFIYENNMIHSFGFADLVNSKGMKMDRFCPAITRNKDG